MTPHDELMALAGKWAEPTPQDDCTLYTMGQRTARNQCAADLRALLDSDAFRAMVRDAWLPIESAPDDTTIMLHGWNHGRPECGSHIVIGSKLNGQFIDREAEAGNRDLGATLTYVTHWRPLPAPPQAIDAAASGAITPTPPTSEGEK